MGLHFKDEEELRKHLGANYLRDHPDVAKQLGKADRDDLEDFDHEDHNGERITPFMVQSVEFHKEFRGYSVAEVDAFLSSIVKELKYLRKKLQRKR